MRSGSAEESSVTDWISRDVLPMLDRPYEGELPPDAKDPGATFPPIEPLLPRDGGVGTLYRRLYWTQRT